MSANNQRARRRALATTNNLHKSWRAGGRASERASERERNTMAIGRRKGKLQSSLHNWPGLERANLSSKLPELMAVAYLTLAMNAQWLTVWLLVDSTTFATAAANATSGPPVSKAPRKQKHAPRSL